MESPVQSPSSHGSPPAESVRRRLDHLHRLVLGTLLSLLVMSLGLNLFIFGQMRAARTQVVASRLLAQNLSEQYEVKEPAMRQFIATLRRFAMSNPDFQPVLNRYQRDLPQFFPDPKLNVAPSPATVTPAPAPSPGQGAPR